MGINKDTLLQVNNLKKHFLVRKRIFSREKLYAKSVDGVSFTINKGKILGLVGESGCGKSTTGKTLLNLIEPTAGSVRFEDEVIFDIENKIYMDKKRMTLLRKDMQIIFQDPYASLNPRMNVESIICEGMKKHKIASGKELKEKCKEILSMCGMDQYSLNKYPSEFSGGQRQRIGIARSFAVNPKFIVCDEPTAALDVSIQSQILNLMLDLKDKFNLTYLFISHNLSVVRYFCDDICVMYLGVIVEKAPAEELYKNPLHPYTKALISSVPRTHPLDERERIQLKGSIPGASNIPIGCRFHTRCPYAKDICRNENPKYKEVGINHFVACHLI